MRPSDESKEREELRRYLERWREAVELHTRGLRSNPQKYAALHDELLERCQARARESVDEQKTFYENVEKLLRPWLNTEVLTQTQRDILLEILGHCRKAERELGGRACPELSRRWRRPVLRALAGATGLGVLGWAALRWSLPLQTLFKSSRFQINTALDHLSVSERWLLGGVIAIVVAMILLSRPAKS